MKLRHLAALLLLLLPATGRADFRSGQKADLVLNAPPQASVYASSIAVDPLSQKIFLCDTASNRVLRYTAASALSGGQPEAVLGQADMLSVFPGTSATCMSQPWGITVDTLGRLWVSDSMNHRILRFDNASALPSGTPASGLLGQADFLSAVPGTAENRFMYPAGLAVDLSGRLWVADSGNHRVLRFDNAAALPSGGFASGVLGQANLTTSTSGTSATKMTSPSALALEHSSGVLVRLWVGEGNGARLLAFNNPATKPNGGAADKVLGQTSFTGSSLVQPIHAGSIGSASGLVMQGTDLWVADSALNRLVRFSNAGSKANGAAADSVLGQFNFAEWTGGSTLDRLITPSSLAVLGARLWVVDYGNQRVLRHEAAPSKSGLAAADGTLGGLYIAPASAPGKASGMAIDAATGKLFVAESGKNRILRFASVAALQAGAQAEAVLGQPDFQTTDSGLSPSKLATPIGLHVDILGNLWVADSQNNRVLRFAGASSLPNGAAAAQVLGNASFTSSLSNKTASGMKQPQSVVTEWGITPQFTLAIRRLWVADAGHARVLRFDNPLFLGNGAAATGVLGQSVFTTISPFTTATGMHWPNGLAVETNGRLWVLDYYNERVLRFDNAAAKSNGAAADGVLFQSTFTDSSAPNYPMGIAVTPQGRLFVSLNQANRVVWLDNAASKPAIGAVDGVLGQPAVSTPVDANQLRELFDPSVLALEPGGRLWVADALYLRRYSPELESRITGYGFNAQNRFGLTILGRGGETYQIRSSTDLKDWSTIERTDTVPGTTTQIMNWTATAPPAGLKKFYRLQLP